MEHILNSPYDQFPDRVDVMTPQVHLEEEKAEIFYSPESDILLDPPPMFAGFSNRI